jgi:hypothetical protein
MKGMKAKKENGEKCASIRIGRPSFEGIKANTARTWLVRYANDYGQFMPDESQYIQLTVFSKKDVYIRYLIHNKYSQYLVLFPACSQIVTSHAPLYAAVIAVLQHVIIMTVCKQRNNIPVDNQFVVVLSLLFSCHRLNVIIIVPI